jgi:glutamate-5-semialdehyde dehydrogenase
VCHVYVHEQADLSMAEAVVVNAKTQRPGTCNAAETLLVDRSIAKAALPKLAAGLKARGVKLLGDAEVSGVVGDTLDAPENWKTEYLDLILAVKLVSGLDEAVDHIETHGSHHSDAIITEDAAAAERFIARVDSAAVLWNASTRLNDGGEFGFGAEIGISTDKIHARGPMALEELTSYKYVARGNGQIRA